MASDRATWKGLIVLASGASTVVFDEKRVHN